MLPSYYLHFKGLALKYLRKTLGAYKTVKRHHFKRFTSQKGREEIYNYKVSKENTLKIKKEGQGLESKTEACVKLSKTEEASELFWSVNNNISLLFKFTCEGTF